MFRTSPRQRIPVFLFLVSFVSLWCNFFSPSAQAEEPTYWRDIRPILRKNCTVCHNSKNLKEFDVSGDLALDTYDGIMKGKHGRVIHPHHSQDSLLLKMITASDEAKRMPRSAPPLPAEAIVLLRRWIDTGAKEGQPVADSTQIGRAHV